MKPKDFAIIVLVTLCVVLAVDGFRANLKLVRYQTEYERHLVEFIKDQDKLIDQQTKFNEFAKGFTNARMADFKDALNDEINRQMTNHWISPPRLYNHTTNQSDPRLQVQPTIEKGER